jgi:hypothetical protein
MMSDFNQEVLLVVFQVKFVERAQRLSFQILAICLLKQHKIEKMIV